MEERSIYTNVFGIVFLDQNCYRVNPVFLGCRRGESFHKPSFCVNVNGRALNDYSRHHITYVHGIS